MDLALASRERADQDPERVGRADQIVQVGTFIGRKFYCNLCLQLVSSDHFRSHTYSLHPNSYRWVSHSSGKSGKSDSGKSGKSGGGKSGKSGGSSSWGKPCSSNSWGSWDSSSSGKSGKSGSGSGKSGKSGGSSGSSGDWGKLGF